MTRAEIEGMSNLKALRTYFDGSTPKLAMAELKELDADGREELGILAKKELMANATD